MFFVIEMYLIWYLFVFKTRSIINNRQVLENGGGVRAGHNESEDRQRGGERKVLWTFDKHVLILSVLSKAEI